MSFFKVTPESVTGLSRSPASVVAVRSADSVRDSLELWKPRHRTSAAFEAGPGVGLKTLHSETSSPNFSKSLRPYI